MQSPSGKPLRGETDLEEQLAMTASDARRAEARGIDFFTKHLEDADPEVWDAIES